MMKSMKQTSLCRLSFADMSAHAFSFRLLAGLCCSLLLLLCMTSCRSNEEVPELEKRLTVDKREVWIPLSEIATGGKLIITTENMGGWAISDATPGITFSKSSATADGTETITIRIGGPRQGSFKLKAGNEEVEIKVKREAMPLDYVAEYNLAGGSQYGSSFSSSNPPGATPTSAQTDKDLRWATGHSNDQSGYYNWYVLKGVTESTYNPNGKNLFSDSFFTTGPGKGYHLPSRWELTGVFSYINVAYSIAVNNSNINEAIEFGGIKKTFANDYLSSGNGTCYALRFKQGTDNPKGGFSLTDFPKATDNSMLCAYRYTRVGSFANNNNLDSHLKIDCVYLGSGFTGTVNDISNESWWATRAAETITRIFPTVGRIYRVSVSGSSTLYHRGNNGYYWSGSEHNSSNAFGAFFDFDGVDMRSHNNKSNGLPVRLFASE